MRRQAAIQARACVWGLFVFGLAFAACKGVSAQAEVQRGRARNVTPRYTPPAAKPACPPRPTAAADPPCTVEHAVAASLAASLGILSFLARPMQVNTAEWLPADEWA